MFDAFRASLAERAQGRADRYAQCFLEPVFATTCERSRRCIPKFMEGVAAKVAFSHDVLARRAPGARALGPGPRAVGRGPPRLAQCTGPARGGAARAFSVEGIRAGVCDPHPLHLAWVAT